MSLWSAFVLTSKLSQQAMMIMTMRFATCTFFHAYIAVFAHWHCTPLYRKHEEKSTLLKVYAAILNLIPKLKVLLPIEDDADPTYFYKVVSAVRDLYTFCYTFMVHTSPRRPTPGPPDASGL
jgi:hypothetical protein